MERIFNIDDRVMIDDQVARPSARGVIYRVVDHLRVDLVLEPVGGGRRVRVKPAYLVPAPTGTATAARVETIPYQPPLNPGQIVTVTGVGWKQPAGQLYVVLKEKADTRVSIARLGGDPQGRYWPGIPRGMLTTVEASRVITEPLAGT
jgi:hypothetical protein